MGEQGRTQEELAAVPDFWQHLGEVYREMKQPGKARAAWLKALAVFPKTADPGDRRKAANERKLQTSVR